MIAAPRGISGERIIEPFVHMARGENALHEHNTVFGKFRHPDGWGAVYKERGSYESYRSVRPAGRTVDLQGSMIVRSSSCTPAAHHEER